MKNKKNKYQSHLYDTALVMWKAPEYLHHEKSKLWYLIAAGILLGLIWYGIATDGWTFSVALIICAGTYYLFQHEVPKNVDIKLSNVGVKIGKHHFPYTNIKAFWIVHDPGFINKLYLRMHSRFYPDIVVSLDDADNVEVKRVLLKHVKELKGHFEPFSDTLVRLFRL